MNEEKDHIKEILGDIVAMDADHITKADLLASAKNYNEEFDYNLSEGELKGIVNEVF